MATGVLASAGVPLSAMSTPTVYAGLAYLPYAGHAPLFGPAWVHPVREEVGQPSSTLINPVRVYPEMWVS